MEIAIVARAKQGYIYRYMVERNMSVRELADVIKIHYATMINIINLRWIPPTRYRKKEDITDRLERFFKLPIEDLFPPELTKEIARKLSAPMVKMLEVDTISLTGIDEKLISYEPDLDEKINIKQMMDMLNDREREVICYRYGFYNGGPSTLAEVAERYGVTQERIGQIEAKAIGKMRWHERKRLKGGNRDERYY